MSMLLLPGEVILRVCSRLALTSILTDLITSGQLQVQA